MAGTRIVIFFSERMYMQMLRQHYDVERAVSGADDLGADASALGQRLVAVAQAAAAMHMAEQVRRSLLACSQPESKASKAGILQATRSLSIGGER